MGHHRDWRDWGFAAFLLSVGIGFLIGFAVLTWDAVTAPRPERTRQALQDARLQKEFLLAQEETRQVRERLEREAAQRKLRRWLTLPTVDWSSGER